MEIKIYKGTVHELKAAGLLDEHEQGSLFDKGEEPIAEAPIVHRSLAEAMRYNCIAMDGGQYEAVRAELAKDWPESRKKRSRIVLKQEDMEKALEALRLQGYKMRKAL